MEYDTRYPRTLILGQGRQDKIRIDPTRGVQQLHIRVHEKFDTLHRILLGEGFCRVNFEHKQPRQLGPGLSLKLIRPWEMHVRLSESDDGILIHAEVEVSRDYMQHLFSQRTPVVYETISILERHGVKCTIWNADTGEHAESVLDNYKIRLASPVLPAFAWKPMVFSIGTVGVFYLIKYLFTV